MTFWDEYIAEAIRVGQEESWSPTFRLAMNVPRRVGKTWARDQVDAMWDAAYTETEVRTATKLIMPVWSEDEWDWDPSITLNKGPGPAERERESTRLMNDLCDALARNGFWWDRNGWVHKA